MQQKSIPQNNIEIIDLKESSDVISEILSKVINKEILNGKFLEELKLPNVTPIHTPVSKLFEKNITKTNSL